MLKKNILIATGVYPPKVGGPALYAVELKREFTLQDKHVRVVTYGIEHYLPTGVRHIVFFLRLITRYLRVQRIIALDTFSVGLPCVLFAKIFKKKIVIRIGGDFLWEAYIERTKSNLSLSEFNKKLFLEVLPKLSAKEKLIFKLSKWTLNNSDALIFTTNWQKDIFISSYNLARNKTYIVENYYGENLESPEASKKTFVWAGRPIHLKNIKILKKVFEELQTEMHTLKLDIITNKSSEYVQERIKNCYAVILPSLSDVSPNFILDGIRYGKPFIMTKETGIIERIKNCGIFIDPLNKEGLKNIVRTLCKDDVYAKYQYNAKCFDFKHSWSDISNEIKNIFDSI